LTICLDLYTELYSLTVVTETRDEHAGPGLVGRVALPQLLAENSLLADGADGEGAAEVEAGDQDKDIPTEYAHPNGRYEHSCVHGVSDEAVRAIGHQLVLLLGTDTADPIWSESPLSPQAESETGEGEGATDDNGKVAYLLVFQGQDGEWKRYQRDHNHDERADHDAEDAGICIVRGDIVCAPELARDLLADDEQDYVGHESSKSDGWHATSFLKLGLLRNT
jgi:hypothetical protein